MTSKVLLIDDDAVLSRTLSVSLRARNFEIVRSGTGESGLAAARRERFEVIVVDLGLPKMSGMTVIDELRKWSPVSIVVLSARHCEATKVEALERGADDYVTKPFGIDELVARIRAALRRGVRADGHTLIESDDLSVDLENKVVRRDDKTVRLTPTEWRLLEVLIGSEGRVVGHDELLTAVWGPDGEAPVEYARVYVAALRRKIEVDATRPRHLITEPGMGYRFNR